MDEALDRCANGRCSRTPCIRVISQWQGGGSKQALNGKKRPRQASAASLIVCLFHYYTSDAALDDDGGGAQAAATEVFDAAEYRRQKIGASDFVNDLVFELEEDIEQEVAADEQRHAQGARIAAALNGGDRLKKIPRVESPQNRGSYHKATTSASKSSSSTKSLSKKTSKSDAGGVGRGTHKGLKEQGLGAVSSEDLYLWQMKQRDKEKQKKSRELEENELRRKRDAQMQKTPSSWTSSVAAAELVKPDASVDGKELDGLENVPLEEWRAKSARLLAVALALDGTVSQQRSGERGLEIERAMYELLFTSKIVATTQGPSSDDAGPPQSDVAIVPNPATERLIETFRRPGERRLGDSEAPAASDEPEPRNSIAGYHADSFVDEARGDEGESRSSRAVSLLRRKASAKTASAESIAQAAYKDRARTLLRNLRIKGNQELRQRILSKALSPEELVKADVEELMDPKSAAKWRLEREDLFRRSKVVAPEDALANTTLVDTALCPQCGNTEKNFMLVTQHQESSKCEIWGNKEDRNNEKERFRCSKCSFHFQ